MLFTALLVACGNGTSTISENDMNTENQVDQENDQIVSDLSSIHPKPGDVIKLESGKVYKGTINLSGIKAEENPITITSSSKEPAIIDAAGELAGVQLTNCSGITIENIKIVANGHDGKLIKDDPGSSSKMRCAILVKATNPGTFKKFTIRNISIENVYYEDAGFKRGDADTHTPNGNEAYGYGIRFISWNNKSIIEDVKISDNYITKVSHTGIKFTSKLGAMNNIELASNKVEHVGGPGIQMSGVQDVHMHHNTVDHSGSINDGRNWKRGSGYWCWGSRNILIEHNSFTHANGPMDSAGAHIDFNCKNVILQYNFSGWNAGGFVEILGNNWNCSYRYNISVDDGYRNKGDSKGCHYGKTLWLSGYVGKGNKPHGPYYTYIYNNTIYVSNKVQSKIAFERATEGALVANNIFYIAGQSIDVANSQPNIVVPPERRNIIFKNNLYLHAETLPQGLEDVSPMYGDPEFIETEHKTPESFRPVNKEMIYKGIKITRLNFDEIGLQTGFEITKDFFGTTITSPIIGAVVPKE